MCCINKIKKNKNKNSDLSCYNKRRTCGILVSIFPCGTIINYCELNKSEGKNLVASFLGKTNILLQNRLKYICYDDACHIFGLNQILKDKIFVIGICNKH